MKFKQEWGSVQSLSFRSDGQPFLVSASDSGHLAVWNLERKRLESQMRHIHSGPVVGTTFVDKQPLLVTNSTDNSLKVFKRLTFLSFFQSFYYSILRFGVSMCPMEALDGCMRGKAIRSHPPKFVFMALKDNMC